jgi:hypothetical protein
MNRLATAMALAAAAWLQVIWVPRAHAWSGNLLQNPGFEQGNDHWDGGGSAYAVNDPAEAHAGDWFLRVGPEAGGRYQGVADPKPNAVYKLTVWAKLTDGDERGWVWVHHWDEMGTLYTRGVVVESEGYEYQEVTFTTPDTVTAMNVDVWKEDGLGYLCVDDVSLVELVLEPSPGNTIYYLDSVGGNDENNGTSPSTAWQSLDRVYRVSFAPGDQILLKAGGVWSGQLWPKGSGAEANPIIVDTYGTGPRPTINGDGLAKDAVRLYNQEYWEISNLEITNYDPAGRGNRRGVRVLGQDGGMLDHVYLRDLDVHDVNGDLSELGYGEPTGGIVFDVLLGSVTTKFNDVLVEGCYVYDCDRSGILTWTEWQRLAGPEWVPHTNVVIRDNVVENAGGAGILVGGADAPLIEHNVAARCVARAGRDVAIWVWETDDAVMQSNEAYLTQDAGDAQGFDIDGRTRRTIVQYNYSHDNHGGFILLCEAPGPPDKYFNDEAIVRYNISQNDSSCSIKLMGANITNVQIYNNTIFIGEEVPMYRVISDGGDENIYYYNNIFYNLAGAPYTFVIATNRVFDGNVFFGSHPESEPDDPHKMTGDPRLVHAGSGGIGLDSVGGYKLAPSSLCIDTGLELIDNGGWDYWGNPLPYGDGIDRGACEYSGESPPVMTLTVDSVPLAGVTVYVEPSDRHWIGMVATPFALEYDWYASVELEAGRCTDGWRFDHWEVDGIGQEIGERRASVSVDGDQNVVAHYRPAEFSDVTCYHWAFDAVYGCFDAGIVAGYPDGLYRPTDSVSRDQMAVYISRALAGGDENVPGFTDTPSFPDVDEAHWAIDYVEYAANQNVVAGYLDGTYNPEYEVTRDQMAVYVARSLVAPEGEAGLADYTPADPRDFPDVASDFWAYKHIEYCVENGVVQGYEDGYYHPDYVVTRDQMAVYVARAFGLLD